MCPDFHDNKFQPGVAVLTMGGSDGVYTNAIVGQWCAACAERKLGGFFFSEDATERGESGKSQPSPIQKVARSALLLSVRRGPKHVSRRELGLGFEMGDFKRAGKIGF
jgi:hypothetical protein